MFILIPIYKMYHVSNYINTCPYDPYPQSIHFNDNFDLFQRPAGSADYPLLKLKN